MAGRIIFGTWLLNSHMAIKIPFTLQQIPGDFFLRSRSKPSFLTGNRIPFGNDLHAIALGHSDSQEEKESEIFEVEERVKENAENNEAEEQQSLNNDVLKHVINITMSKYPFMNQSLRVVNRFFLKHS